MFQKSELVSDPNQWGIIHNKLMDYVKVLYGLIPENLPPLLFNLVYDEIKQIKDLTVSDLDNAFITSKIEKRAYVSLTRDELLKPIKDYVESKRLINLEVDKVLRLENEAIEDKINVDKFIKHSKEKYTNCFKNGGFDLDEFESNTIYKPYVKLFTEIELESFKEETIKEFAQRTFEAEDNSFILVPHKNRIFARIVMQNAFKRNVEI